MAESHNSRVGKRKITAPAASIPAIRYVTPTPTKKPLLNKTESLWRLMLESRGYKQIYAQALTLRIGDDCRYTPDFLTVVKLSPEGTPFLTCWECKAPHRFREKGIVKIKAAAKQYPFIRFVLVMRDGGNWTEREIGKE